MSEKITVQVGDKQIHIETGKLAKQADGAVSVQMGETIVIVATALTNGDIASVDDTLVRHVIRKPFDVQAVIASLTEAVNELHAKATFVVAEPPAESEPKEGENEPPKLNLRTPC